MTANIAHIAAPPPGWRMMSAHEAECMQYADAITLWDGDKHYGVVTGHTDEHMHVMLRSGAKIRLDLDSPDYWPDSVTRDRMPPTDGELVAIRRTDADDDDIEPLMRVSVALAEKCKGDPELAVAVARVREILSLRLRGRAA